MVAGQSTEDFAVAGRQATKNAKTPQKIAVDVGCAHTVSWVWHIYVTYREQSR